MDTTVLNKRKAELLDQQEKMLKAATDAKVWSADDNAKFEAFSKEIDDLNGQIKRAEAVNRGKLEIANPREVAAVVDNAAKEPKFRCLGGTRRTNGNRRVISATTPLKIQDEAYIAKFWRACKSKNDFDRFMIQNAALGEGGTAADGSALVPIETDPTIPYMQIEECSARQLSRVITTEMNINVPYQSALTTSALKAESNNSGTNAFATNVPQFATTLLSAWVLGDTVAASWELLEDAKAANQFIPFDLQRSIVTKEENLFISGTGSSQPQGYLGNATTATGASITAGAAAVGINPILDTLGSLNKRYYMNAKWLVNRREALRLYKAQVAASQFQTYFTFNADGSWSLLGFPMEFSGEMPVYNSVGPVNGVWLFGDFASFAVIGDRGDSNIRIKVLDQVAALNGQTVILGYRRVDQRIVLQEAVVELQTSS